jgi:hypothetical protein
MLLTELALAAILTTTPAPEPKPDRSERPAIVTGLQAGKPIKFVGGLSTQVEGMALAILGSCSADVSLEVGKQRWTKAAAADHIRITYPNPRPLGMGGGNREEVLQVTEILLPISATESPDFVLVREGEKYRAFSRFAREQTQLLKGYLDSIRKAR